MNMIFSSYYGENDLIPLIDNYSIELI